VAVPATADANVVAGASMPRHSELNELETNGGQGIAPIAMTFRGLPRQSGPGGVVQRPSLRDSPIR